MMQSKRFRALAMVGALTMAVCTGTTAMAEEAAPMGNSPEIRKIFQMSEGMDVPSVSFKFTLEKVTADAPTAQVSPMEACMAAGMNEHLAKPIRIEEVVQVLAKYL